MKVLHTADIHLREHDDERWETLLKLIKAGKKEKINLLVISGDLFDKGVDAEKLRPKIRKIFSDNGFKVVMIPGNHDQESFRPGLFFGDDTIILTDPQKPFEFQNIRIAGLPFEKTGGEEILNALNDLKKIFIKDKVNILLFHGELLDSFFSPGDFGEEDTRRYMPVWLDYFDGLNVSYILAGHFHTKFDDRKLKNGGYFVYPGSPISITKKELGQRKVNIFEVGKPPKPYPLISPHFQKVEVVFDPLGEKDPAKKVKEHLEKVNPEARVLLSIKGCINGRKFSLTEEELKNKIEEMAQKARVEGPVSYEFIDVREIVESELFKNFSKKLDESGIQEEKKKSVIDTVMKAMAEARS